jgi:hypothetical protein
MLRPIYTDKMSLWQTFNKLRFLGWMERNEDYKYPCSWLNLNPTVQSVATNWWLLSQFCKSIFHVPRYNNSPITVAAQSKVWTVFARSNTGVVGLNPTRGMDICVRLFCFCAVLCVSRGLATDWSPVQGVLPTVYRISKLKKRPKPNKGL